MTQRQPDMFQCLAHINKLRSRSIQVNDGKVDWLKIKNNTLKSAIGSYLEDIDDFIDFVKMNGDDRLMTELVHFSRKSVRHGIRIPGNLFKHIAGLKVAPQDLMPEFMHAVLMATASAKDRLHRWAI